MWIPTFFFVEEFKKPVATVTVQNKKKKPLKPMAPVCEGIIRAIAHEMT